MNREEQTKITQQLIIDSAMKVFGEKDYASTSISNICEAAGLSKGIIYHYYESKKMLYLTCIKICFDNLVKHLDTFPKSTGNIEEAIGEYIRYRHQFFEDNPDIKNVFFGAMLGGYHGFSSEIIEQRTCLDQANIVFFKDMLKHVKFTDGILAEDAIQLFIMLSSCSIIMPKMQTDPYEPHAFMMEQEKFIRKTMKIIFHGIEEDTRC